MNKNKACHYFVSLVVICIHALLLWHKSESYLLYLILCLLTKFCLFLWVIFFEIRKRKTHRYLLDLSAWLILILRLLSCHNLGMALWVSHPHNFQKRCHWSLCVLFSPHIPSQWEFSGLIKIVTQTSGCCGNGLQSIFWTFWFFHRRLDWAGFYLSWWYNGVMRKRRRREVFSDTICLCVRVHPCQTVKLQLL